MAAEIMARGPIACGVDANPLLNYTGGIISTAGAGVDHIVSVIGWGTEAGSKGHTGCPLSTRHLLIVRKRHRGGAHGQSLRVPVGSTAASSRTCSCCPRATIVPP